MQIKNVREEKKKLRAGFRLLRNSFSEEERKVSDRAMQKKLFSLHQYGLADTVLTYVSKDTEPDTIRIIQKAWRDGKRVAVPRCIDGTCEMAFYYLTSLKQLSEGSFGVLEPLPSQCQLFEGNGKGSICIVPGMAFDCEGYRLGYGKGYYDRFLSGYEGFTVGVCYSKCVKWSLPRSKYDKPVDMLVTEKFFRKIKKSSEKRGAFSNERRA